MGHPEDEALRNRYTSRVYSFRPYPPRPLALHALLAPVVLTHVLVSCGASPGAASSAERQHTQVAYESYGGAGESVSMPQSDAESDSDESHYRGAPAAAPVPSSAAGSGGNLAIGGDDGSTHTPPDPTPPPPDSQAGQATSDPAKRMVYYSGQARLGVTKPEEAVDQAISLAKEHEGFVEQRGDSHVTLRVPVAVFEDAFDALLSLGDIRDHSVSAQDVTDRYTAVELRLRVLTASRDRFMELLKKAKTEQEKLSLLAQISRLTEQIDRHQIESDTLKSLADFSRIHLQFEARGQKLGTVHEPVVAFRWIYELSPFASLAITDEQDYLEFVIPEGFVLFDEDDDRWRAETANGTVIWAYERENEPRGTSDFWIDAIDHRLTKTYESGSRATVGSYRILKLVDGSRQGYRFWTAVRAHDDTLEVVHVYFPSEEHQKRFQDAVLNAFTRAKGEQ